MTPDPKRSSPRRTALCALLPWLLIACLGGCNLNDPDVIRDSDSGEPDTMAADATEDSTVEDTAGDVSTDATDTTDASDDSSGDGADTTCEELSVSDFCEANDATCGSFTGEGLCVEERTEICGTCANSDVCANFQCVCKTPWAGDGINAAFSNRTDVFVINVGHLWKYNPQENTWTAPVALATATNPVDFASAPRVDGTALWDEDGPTAAVRLDKAFIFFHGSLFWVYDSSEGVWAASGDLNDPAQTAFDLRRSNEPNLFGDGRIDAAVSEGRKDFMLIRGDVFHELEFQDRSPVEVELKTSEPIAISELFPEQNFDDNPARPWDSGMNWGTYGEQSLTSDSFVVIGSGNQSWIGPQNGPFTYAEVAAQSEIYQGAACMQ